MPIFKRLSTAYITEIILKLKPVLYMPNECIISEGEIGNAMFFITTGSVSIFINGVHVNSLKEGDFFGEIAIFLKSQRRTATVKSNSYCDFFKISKKDMQELMLNFQNDSVEIKKVA